MQNLNVNISDLKFFACPSCGENTFENLTKLLIVGKFQSPTGNPELLNVPAFKCTSCSFILDDTNKDKILKDLETAPLIT